jgi:putative transposase
MAIHEREVGPGLIHRSDQGSQYSDGDYRQSLKGWGIQVSTNGVGSWYDNVPMESFFGTLKSEWVQDGPSHTRDEARADLPYYLEAF